jgi:hypothetical protein
MTTTRQLKLFGTFRSGSNYLKSLLELNYDVKVLSGNGGFKHAPVPAIYEAEQYRPFPLPILATVKDPYAWLVSMWRYVNDVGARHTIRGSRWHTFLREPLVIFEGTIEGFPRYRFANPVEYWTALNYNLLSLAEPARCIVRYEDVLADPEAQCSRVAAHFEVARTSDAFVPVTRRVRNMDDRDRPREVDAYVRGEEFDTTAYRNRSFDGEFSKRDRRFVHDCLDADVCRRLGYGR